ncbi:MAG TPA: lytic murein transglycosylase [Candidatus Paceibacterota bacterium]|jgi:membrane-bound lytic murein transglycosylase B|nr:lytic murein transglycosylase [Candidatus Paceibacterota bacterium]
MSQHKTRIILSLLLILSVPTSIIPFSATSVAHAQSTTSTSTPAVCTNPSNADIAQACADYAAENKVLAQLQAQLADQKSKSGSLQKNVNALVSQITATQAKISGEISTINSLSLQIGQKQKAINDLNSQLDRENASMAQLITRTDELDQKGATYVLLSAGSISDFYQDLDDFFSIKQDLYSTLNYVKQIKTTTQTQEQQLQDQQSQAVNAKNALTSAKAQLAASQKQAQQLLNNSKSAEQTEAALVAQQQAKVAAIQSKLFSFAGGATGAIPFSQAYAYATTAQNVTGVPAAFTLAILTQESNLGKNVGTCNRAGDPPSKSYVNVMNPTRDQPIFLKITAALGLDPNTTPVSCPIGGGGWGGAMGPAQFIPSTWQLIAPQVASALGEGTANPWNARDAIVAAAVYLKARGADNNATNQRNAACKYYSGRSCDGKSPPNSFYGNSVMTLTRSIQADIDYLVQYGVSKR